jgi:hypothetical protein
MLMGDEVPPRREFIEKMQYANIDAINKTINVEAAQKNGQKTPTTFLSRK